MNKFSGVNNKVNKEDDDIEEDIKYEGKFDNVDDIDYEQDDFIESISNITNN
jgi:hypothetical protein